MTMRYLSVCSGIEAATVAWHPLGWEPAAFSEIEKFPRAVLQHHYPDVPLHGDFTTIGEDDYGPIDLLVGGTPCQSFSIAGLRGGMDDDRGNLALEFLRLAQRKGSKWLVWENVPGVLSSNGGRDFGSILGGMAEIGYGCAYRILDAQYFGVPQRRRRVFVIGYFGDWRPATAVLFEQESLRRHPAPRREKGQKTAKSLRGRPNASLREDSGTYIPTIAKCLVGDQGKQDAEVEQFIVHGVPVGVFKAGQGAKAGGIGYSEQLSPTLSAAESGSNRTPCIHYTISGRDRGDDGRGYERGPNISEDIAGTVDTVKPDRVLVPGQAVRRLTPVECERLQGFPDNYTKVPHRNKAAADCPDGPRYKALGNSMAVPVMRWIGERIHQVEQMSLNSQPEESK